MTGWVFFFAVALADGHWRSVLVGSVIGLALGVARHGWPWTWGRQ